MNGKGFFRQHQFFIIGAIFAISTILGVIILGLLGWPGEPEQCFLENTCYCENMESNAVIRQPVNTWSNLLAVFLGLGFLWYVDTLNNRKESQNKENDPMSNPMQEANLYTGLYGILMIFVGTGSMYFHAGGMLYGGFIDNLSMNTFISFLIVYSITRIFQLSKKSFLIVYISLNAVLASFVKLPGVPMGRIQFGIMVAVAVILEFIIASGLLKKQIKFTRSLQLYLMAVIVFVTAFIIWNLSKDGAILCAKDSLWQGHAFWHYLVAMVTLILYFYLKSEQPIIQNDI